MNAKNMEEDSPYRKPSVLFINRVYPPDSGATGRMLRDLAWAFAEDGWAVTVLTTGSKRGKTKDGDITVRSVGAGLRGKTAFGYGRVLIRLLGAGLVIPRHDLVVSMTDPPLLVWAGGTIARFKGSRHMHWCQDVYPALLPVMGYRFPAWLTRIMSGMSRRAMRRCDRVVVIGRCMGRKLVQHGIAANSLSVIPNWPEEKLAQADDSEARESEKFRVLYAGTLGRAHPVEGVLDAAALLLETHPEIEFMFVGDGAGYDWLAQERGRRGLYNVKQLPRQPEERLPALMGSGDLHLVALNPDAAGLLVPCKLYAALAAGRPLLLAGPEHCEVARVITEHGCGITAAHDDGQAIAAAIARYCEDAALWREACAAAARAGALFVPQASHEAWLDRARTIVRPSFAAGGMAQQDSRQAEAR